MSENTNDKSKTGGQDVPSTALFCWKFECFTDAKDAEQAWNHLRYLVEIATEYCKENGEYPGMAAEAPHGSITLREDQWGNLVRENERFKQNARVERHREEGG